MGSENFSILLIDDDPDIRNLFKEAFTDSGYHFSSAGTAADGLGMLTSQDFDLSIIDGRLPDFSGVELCRKLRAENRFAAFPIIFLSAYYKNAETFRELVSDLKIDLILHKPIDPMDLVQHVNRMLAVSDSPTDQSQKQALDMLGEMRQEYFDTFWKRLKDIEAILESFKKEPDGKSVLDVLLSITHKIHGSAGTFGFSTVSEIAGEWEELIHKLILHHSPISEEVLKDFDDMFVRIKEAILLYKPRDKKEESEQSQQTRLRSILVVDPDRQLFKELKGLNQFGEWRLKTAETPEAALALLHDGFRPDVVFLEIVYDDSKMDGYRLAREIRYSSQASEAPIVFVSRKDNLLDRVESTRAGAIRHLDKPVAPEIYFQTSQEILDSINRDRGTIMVLDDDKLILTRARNILENAGYAVITTDDPTTLWDRMIQEKPDLLILDLYMPGFNGIDICRAIRSDKRWMEIPLLVLTASRRREDLVQVFKAGADDYIQKPIIEEVFLARITSRVERIKAAQAYMERDFLTKTLNRSAFTDRLNAYIARAKRDPIEISIALIDLDHFKEVNDTYGHNTGDAVLMRLGAVLLETFRQEDLVCRWGGEEFVVALPYSNLHDGLHAVARALEEFRGMTFKTENGHEFNVTFSAGISIYPEDGIDIEQLVNKADSALYAAKDRGRNRVIGSGFDEKEQKSEGAHDIPQIVIVEDDHLTAEVIGKALETRGYSYEIITDGAEANKRLTDPDHPQLPELLIMDLHVPGANAFDLMDKLQIEINAGKIKVIIISVEATDEATEMSFNKGAVDYVVKPFSLPLLLHRVRVALALKRGRRKEQ